MITLNLPMYVSKNSIYLTNHLNILFLQAFVDSNPTMKWCPSPGCGRAVRLPSSMLPSLHVAVEARSSEETEPIIVDCGHGHFFCWQVLTRVLNGPS